MKQGTADDPQRHALLALEVRAFGCLLEELLALAEPPKVEHVAAFAGMADLARACMGQVPAQRPVMREAARQLSGLMR